MQLQQVKNRLIVYFFEIKFSTIVQRKNIIRHQTSYVSTRSRTRIRIKTIIL